MLVYSSYITTFCYYLCATTIVGVTSIVTMWSYVLEKWKAIDKFC